MSPGIPAEIRTLNSLSTLRGGRGNRSGVVCGCPGIGRALPGLIRRPPIGRWGKWNTCLGPARAGSMPVRGAAVESGKGGIRGRTRHLEEGESLRSTRPDNSKKRGVLGAQEGHQRTSSATKKDFTRVGVTVGEILTGRWMEKLNVAHAFPSLRRP